jgi:hypothetical protein
MFCIRLPLATRAQVASLNLAADRRQAFDTTDIAIASIFARHAAAALDRARDGDDLRAAVRSRQLIGVAEGILMQRFGLGLDQAFELLRRYSQSHNIKLRVLAERLVETGQLTTAADATRSLDAAFGLQPED